MQNIIENLKLTASLNFQIANILLLIFSIFFGFFVLLSMFPFYFSLLSDFVKETERSATRAIKVCLKTFKRAKAPIIITTLIFLGIFFYFKYTWATNIFWTERQPAGAQDLNWNLLTESYDGTFLVAGSSTVGAGKARLYKSINSGISWTEMQPAGNTDKSWFKGACDSDCSTILVSLSSAGNGAIYLSTNFGANWTYLNSHATSEGFVAVDSDGTNLIYALSYYRLYTSSDSGVNWTERQPAGDYNKNWSFVASDSTGTYLMTGYPNSATVFISSNSGVNWTTRSPNGVIHNWDSADMSANGSEILLAATGEYSAYGRLFVSHNYGVNWTETRPLGDADKNWYSAEINSTGQMQSIIRPTTQFFLSDNFGVDFEYTTPPIVSFFYFSSMAELGSNLMIGGARLYTGYIPNFLVYTLGSLSVGSQTWLKGSYVGTDEVYLYFKYRVKEGPGAWIYTDKGGIRNEPENFMQTVQGLEVGTVYEFVALAELASNPNVLIEGEILEFTFGAPIYSVFNFEYTEYSPYETPSATFTNIKNAVDYFFNSFYSWTVAFSSRFDIEELTENVELVTDKILVVRAYFGLFDNFFGGFPIAIIFIILVLVYLAKVIFTWTHRSVQTIKP